VLAFVPGNIRTEHQHRDRNQFIDHAIAQGVLVISGHVALGSDMNTATKINGHPAQHALQETRNAKGQVGNALSIALQYLQIAHMTNRIHALGFDLPSDKEIAAALDTVQKSLHP